MISLQPTLSGGERVYTIVFSSNAPNPGNFDGTEGTLAQDANSEIWIYRFSVPDVDLTAGTDFSDDLTGGTFTRITDTPASRLPTAGSTTKAPFFADDNREMAISDDGNILAFISTRNLVPGVGNADGNPELFFFNIGSTSFTQATNTTEPTPSPGFSVIFQSNPSLSSDGSIVSFISSANLAGNNSDNNAEIYLANFSGSSVSNVRQVTRTINGTGNTNILSPGRRLSRNGAFLAFESRATDPKANTTATNGFLGIFVYTVATDTFVEIGPPRPTVIADIIHFPTFTDYNGSLSPSSLIFASAENFRPDGTVPPAAQASEGLNQQRSAQIFLTPIPVVTPQSFVRLTNVPQVNIFGGTFPAVSETRKRIAFVLNGVEMGGGNLDFSSELFYLLTPTATAQNGAALSFFTGFSNMPVTSATPAPSPLPSPTPTPSPVPGAPFGVAPGEVTIVRSPVAFTSSSATVGSALDCCSETERAPALPIELNGVSVSVNGVAAGLYFVGGPEKRIDFVVPIGLPPVIAPVVINVLDTGAGTDTMFRGLLQIIPGQPDIGTSTGDAGGRAVAFAVNGVTRSPEPFSVTTGGQPTRIELTLTGVRFATTAEITVTVGTTAIATTGIVRVGPNTNMHGFDVIEFTLPAALAGAGDVPIQVQFQRGNLTTVSRPAATAPHITIN
jgi:hypothetical protein